MSNQGMQPQRSDSSRDKANPKPPKLMGDPLTQMDGAFTWNGSAVTISFPGSDFYSDDTAQTWTWNATSRPLAAATRSQSFTASNAAGNTLTVVQTRPSGAVTFKATGISQNQASATLEKQ